MEWLQWTTNSKLEETC